MGLARMLPPDDEDYRLVNIRLRFVGDLDEGDLQLPITFAYRVNFEHLVIYIYMNEDCISYL